MTEFAARNFCLFLSKISLVSNKKVRLQRATVQRSIVLYNMTRIGRFE